METEDWCDERLANELRRKLWSMEGREGKMEEIRTKIGAAGGLSLPAEYREFLGVKPGDEVILKPVSGEIRIVPVKQAIQRAQELVRKYVPSGGRLAEALIQERREEAKRE